MALDFVATALGLLCSEGFWPSRPGVTFFARAKKVTKESTPHVRARSTAAPTNGSPAGATCSGSRRRDILSRRSSGGHPCPPDPCARHSSRRYQGSIESTAARLAALAVRRVFEDGLRLQPAHTSKRGLLLLAVDVPGCPCGAPSSAARAGDGGQDARRASPRQEVASKRLPRAREQRRASAQPMRHQGVLSLGYFSLHKQREVTPVRRGQKSSAHERPHRGSHERKQSREGDAQAKTKERPTGEPRAADHNQTRASRHHHRHRLARSRSPSRFNHPADAS